MKTISLYLFLLSSSKLVHLHSKNMDFYAKFSAEFNEISLFFCKQQENVEKQLRLKYSKRTPLGVIRRLRVKKQVKTPQEALKEVACSFSDSFSFCNANRLKMRALLEITAVSWTKTCQDSVGSSKSGFFHLFWCKKLKMKAFLEVHLVLSTLRARTVSKNLWKKTGNFPILFCCTAVK